MASTSVQYLPPPPPPRFPPSSPSPPPPPPLHVRLLSVATSKCNMIIMSVLSHSFRYQRRLRECSVRAALNRYHTEQTRLKHRASQREEKLGRPLWCATSDKNCKVLRVAKHSLMPCVNTDSGKSLHWLL